MRNTSTDASKASSHASGSGKRKVAPPELQEVVRLIEAGRVSEAASYYAAISEISHMQDSLMVPIFLRALSKRLNERGDLVSNLYLQEFEHRQIDLFDLIARRMPLVTVAAAAANTMILDAARKMSEVTLIDVGIGTGRQEVELLERLTQESHPIESLHVMGIEPGKEALVQAEDRLRRLAEDAGIDFSFTGIASTAEELSEEQWHLLECHGEGAIINEAFALHHIAPSAVGRERKSQVIRRLAALKPSRIIVSEPHSDHESASLSARFENAWNHFGLVFSFIDQLDLLASEREAMKADFFGREIDDILGQEESKRTERHERAEMWLQKFSGVGFTPRFSNNACSIATQLSQRTPLQVLRKDDYLSLGVEDQTIVAIFNFEPDTSRSFH